MATPSPAKAKPAPCYLLVRPVGRTHLLLAKLVTVVAFVLLAVLVVAAVSYAEGRLLLGRAPTTGTVSLSGSTLTQQELAWRTALALGYVIISMLGVARGRAVLLDSDEVLDRCRARNHRRAHRLDRAARPGCRGTLHPSADPLLAAFVDLFRDPILWRDVVRGLVVQLGYLAVFTLAAWANFGTKDIDD